MDPRPGSMGKPAPIYDIIIMDNECKPNDIGEEGEIVIKTGEGKPLGLFGGYYLNPRKTRVVWYDGCYHTGDTA